MDARALLFLIVLFTFLFCDDARVKITRSQSTVPVFLSAKWEINDQVLQHENKMGDEDLCIFCEVVLCPIIHDLFNTTTQSEILSILHLICGWTFIAENECKAIVDHYVPLIFNETSRLTPREICTIVGLCINQQTDLSQNNNCESCNNHQYPGSDQMQMVHEKLLEACNSLEDSVNDYCKRIVMENAQLIPVYPKENLHT